MKTIKKSFDAVQFMREQRDIRSEELSQMTAEEILEFFKNRKNDSSTKPCA